MTGFFNREIAPRNSILAKSLGIKKINVEDQSETKYPSVWKKLGFNPESGWDAKNINKLELKYDNVHSRVPF